MPQYLMKTHIGMIAVFCLSMISNYGCAGLGKTLERPKMNLAHLEIKEVRSFETVLQVDLRVINPNDVPIDVKGIDCDLSLNGRNLATGVSKVEKQIPAFGSEVVPVTLYSSLLDVVRGVIGMDRKNSLKFQISGKLHLGGGLLMPSTFSFSEERELSLDEFNPQRQ